MIWRRVLYRFVRSSGPERIGAEWWLSRRKLKLTEETDSEAKSSNLERYYEEGRDARDYFIAEDESGRRFWIFRRGLFEITASPQWFLHGFFA
jgi:protein ImuB